MMTIKYIRTALFAFTLVAVTPSATLAQTLSDSLVATYKHSGLLKQNRALLRAADEDVAQAIAKTRPILNWSLSARRQTPRSQFRDLITASLGLSGQLTLYDGGANQFAINAQKEIVLATRQSLIDIESQLFLQTVESYVNVRRDTSIVALRRNNVSLISKEYKAAQERFDVGEVTQTDVALAQARLASAKSALASAQGALKRSKAFYKSVTGQNAKALKPVSNAQLLKSEADAIAYAARHNPKALEAQHTVAAAEFTLKRAQTSYTPNLSLGGAINIDQDRNHSRELNLTLSGPISQGGALKSQMRQFSARRDAARAALHTTQSQIERSVRDAYALLNIAKASKTSSRQGIKAAQTAFNGIKEEATLGTRTTLDVLNAEQELLNVRANAVSAQADEVLSSYRVLSAMGLLTAEYLKLPVQIYDVTSYYNLATDNNAHVEQSAQGQALDRVLKALSK